MENLAEIISDLSVNGQYQKFYEQFDSLLNQFPERSIENMKESILFINPELSIRIENMHRAEILYEYSKLL